MGRGDVLRRTEKWNWKKGWKKGKKEKRLEEVMKKDDERTQ